MDSENKWRAELKTIVDLMRDVSQQTDPHAAAELYGRRLREAKLVPWDAFLGISRRELEAPAYRITRSSTWERVVNPWEEKDRLPLFTSGLLGELIYRDEPTIIEDLPPRIASDDPAAEYFRGMKMLVTIPNYDSGHALNMNVILLRDPAAFKKDSIPGLVWNANLWGRSVQSLVLRKQLKEAYDALDRELQQVGELQRSLLPQQLPRIPGLELAAEYRTSQRAGGDYYDLFNCGKGKWGILIADVSGHGPPAAVIMAITHAIAHQHPGFGVPPGELLTYINRSLVSRYTNGGGTFVTAFYGVYDPASRTLTYARAGHNPPRLVRNKVVTELSEVGGLPLGITDESPYEDVLLPLQPNDLVLFYTDGITEAKNRAGELYGVPALDQVLAKAAGGGAHPTLKAIVDAVDSFASGAARADDQTLLAMCLK